MLPDLREWRTNEGPNISFRRFTIQFRWRITSPSFRVAFIDAFGIDSDRSDISGLVSPSRFSFQLLSGNRWRPPCSLLIFLSRAEFLFSLPRDQWKHRFHLFRRGPARFSSSSVFSRHQPCLPLLIFHPGSGSLLVILVLHVGNLIPPSSYLASILHRRLFLPRSSASCPRTPERCKAFRIFHIVIPVPAINHNIFHVSPRLKADCIFYPSKTTARETPMELLSLRRGALTF